MPIPVTPIETVETVVTETPIACDRLNIDTLTINGTGRDDTSKPPTLTLTVAPYQEGTPNRYAGQTITYTTADLYAAAARVPAIGQAIGAVFAAVAEWHAYNDARRADLAAAQAAHAAAVEQAAALVAAAETAFAAADTAYVEVYQARTGVDDPAWLAAVQTRQEAAVACAVAEAQAAQLTAPTAARLAVAQAAVDDPANPPLTEAE